MGLTTRQRLMPLGKRFRPIHEQEPASAAAPQKKTPPAPEKLKPKKPRASAKRRKASPRRVLGEFAPDSFADSQPPGTPAAEVAALKRAPEPSPAG